MRKPLLPAIVFEYIPKNVQLLPGVKCVALTRSLCAVGSLYADVIGIMSFDLWETARTL